MDKIEVRVTRPIRYPKGSHEHERQGWYFRGVDYEDAIAKAKLRFPDEPLDITVWKRFSNGFWMRSS